MRTQTCSALSHGAAGAMTGRPTDLSLLDTQDPPVPGLIPLTMTTMTSERPRHARQGSRWLLPLDSYSTCCPVPPCPPRSSPRGLGDLPWRDERTLRTLYHWVSSHRTEPAGLALPQPRTAARRCLRLSELTVSGPTKPSGPPLSRLHGGVDLGDS